MKPLLLLSFFIVISSCHSPDKIEIINPKHAFKIIKATDSTSFLRWTNGKTNLRSSKSIGNHYLDHTTYLQWSNERYICLRHSNGSDTWTDLILPFNSNEIKLYENTLAYDKVNGIVVYETDSLPYKLVAESIDGNKKQFLGENWKNCSSLFPHYCIDSIYIENKELYVDWVFPNKIDKPNKAEVQKMKLTF
ncbi:hypothetical protein [Chryseobacterium viscerum]|uniref:Uncharacterized protein n=1 Tax=Chryseobacterium viscerum TaxID=1037377 RepID=A0A5N4BP27_9FLAO|nr:hypothetical protein [Chryseobacterium viscerum]KAB1230177.1 hypothetical protein F8D52_13400 [Chryseobacterium viscerum]